MTWKKFFILALLLLSGLALGTADLNAQTGQKVDISISKNRLDWRTWQFQALGINDANVYLWDFGDGQLSDELEPVHSWPRWGKYKITLSVSDSTGGVSLDEERINIGFWHIQNFWLQGVLGFLGLAAAILILLIIFNKLPKLKI